MKAYTETERLIRLLKEADKNASDKLITDYEEAVADNAEYLLAHGVIAPPCRVGDKYVKSSKGDGLKKQNDMGSDRLSTGKKKFEH